MDTKKFKLFMAEQVEEIRKFLMDRTDIDTAIHTWVQENSANYRENWEKDHT